MQNIYLILLGALLAIDQYTLCRVLYHPLVSCTIAGAILGDAAQGALIGGMLEVTLYGVDTAGMRYSAGSAGLASISAVIMAVRYGLNANAAVLAAAVLFLVYRGFGAAGAVIANLFLPGARKAAASGKSLVLSVFVPLLLSAAIYAFAVYFVASSDVLNFLEEMVAQGEVTLGSIEWILNGLSAVGALLPCIGFAVLLRNISMKNLQGAFFAGCAVAAIAGAVMGGPAALAVCGAAAFAAAAYDYHNAAGQNTADKTVKGGAQKWW